nr:immunoglobulin light chain junction region [Macaca mulatta]MOV76143.1 immunoglobulin light chain junction region [Macaca mulatta]
CHQYNSAPHSF